MAYATVLLVSLEKDTGEKALAAAVEFEDEDELVGSLVGEIHDVSALGRKVPVFDTDDLT